MPWKKLIFATLLLVLFLITAPFWSDNAYASISERPQAAEGYLDLSNWQQEEGVINIDGQWEFYWSQLLEPGELNIAGTEKSGYINLPGSWNGHTVDGQKLSGDGYATYRLTFNTEEENKRLGLKIPRIFTSYRLWANDKLIASAGTVGETQAQSTPQYLPQVAFFDSRQAENEIVVQVANFNHRSGGILESLAMGEEQQILHLRLKNIAYELFLFGSLIIIGAYHLALFAFRKKDYTPLYFGLFCIFVAMRTLLVGEQFFIFMFPAFSWEAAHKLQTLTFYLGLPLIVMFFKSIFAEYMSAKIVRIVQVVGLAFSALVLFSPAKIFTLFNPAFQVFAIMVVVYLAYILIINLHKKKISTTLIVTGALAMLIATVHDIVFLSIWMSDHGSAFLRTFIASGNLSSYGQLIFVFTYSLALAQKFSHAFVKEEEMTQQLKEMNINLDSMVRKRTDALEKSNKEKEYQKAELEKANLVLQQQSLKDPLTDLWNRRHFDETLHLEWKRALRYKRPLSLLMIDIDQFKAYNDNYGHQAGDKCLQRVAKELMSAFSRASDLAVRYGGEEFIVIIPELEREEVLEKAYSVRKAVENLKIEHKHSPVSCYVTISIGVAATVPDKNSSPKDLLLEADKALYRAKAVGRNRVQCFS